MSLFTVGSARAVLVVALVYSFPDVFNAQNYKLIIIHRENMFARKYQKT
jgi:hypothetical protein